MNSMASGSQADEKICRSLPSVRFTPCVPSDSIIMNWLCLGGAALRSVLCGTQDPIWAHQGPIMFCLGARKAQSKHTHTLKHTTHAQRTQMLLNPPPATQIETHTQIQTHTCTHTQTHTPTHTPTHIHTWPEHTDAIESARPPRHKSTHTDTHTHTR